MGITAVAALAGPSNQVAPSRRLSFLQENR
jgi:hypothetical protein